MSGTTIQFHYLDLRHYKGVPLLQTEPSQDSYFNSSCRGIS